MAQMNYPHAPNGCQPGERVVFNALKRSLPNHYTVYFEPTLFGRRQSARPDFVVLGRDIGLILIEVKDWSLDRIHSATRDTVQLVMGTGLDTRTNPEKQAEQHVRAMFDELERYQQTDPEKYRTLLEKNGRYEGKLAAPVSYLVAFPHINRRDWLAANLQHPMNENRLVFGDELNDTLPDRLRRTPPFLADLSEPQLTTLNWMICPDVRVPYKQGQLFTLDAEQVGLAKIDTYLPPDTQLLTRKPQAKLVRGVVGSGKTLILLYRAKFLSEQNPNWRILVLTYNKALRDYLRQIFEQIGGNPDRVEIVNFHKWCRELLLAHGLFKRPHDAASQKGLIANLLKETPATEFEPEFLADEFNWLKERLDYTHWADYLDPKKVKRTGRERGLGRDEGLKRQQIYDLFCRYQARLAQENMSDWADVPVTILKAMDENVIPREQYHAVLIDEAQDFAPAWFRVAFRIVKPETGMVFIVGDGAQKIYARDFTWKELGLGITSQNSFVLRRSYRSTREIIDVALEAIRDSHTLLADLKSAGDSLLEPETDHADLRHGPLPVLLSFETPDKEYAGVAGQILSLLQQGFLPRDIVILQRHRSGSEKIAQELRKRGIAGAVVGGTLDMADPTVKICTFHSAKGLEFEVVFICGLEQFTVAAPVETGTQEFQQLLDQERKLLYVGMTRARRLLYITYSGIAPAWILSRLAGKLEAMRPG